jgi:hypothetical protein
LVLRFEDLVADPVGTAEKIRAVYPLPAPRDVPPPTFRDLRDRPSRFGPGSEVTDSEGFRRNFFRRGEVGGWRDEMPATDRLLFYHFHGRTLRAMGYRVPLADRLRFYYRRGRTRLGLVSWSS